MNIPKIEYPAMSGDPMSNYTRTVFIPGADHINTVRSVLYTHCTFGSENFTAYAHRVGGNRKRYQQSTDADKKSIERVFSIAICRQWGDK